MAMRTFSFVFKSLLYVSPTIIFPSTIDHKCQRDALYQLFDYQYIDYLFCFRFFYITDLFYEKQAYLFWIFLKYPAFFPNKILYIEYF